MSLRDAYKSIRVLEGAENYKIADDPFIDHPVESDDIDSNEHINSEYDFWDQRINNPEDNWNKKVRGHHLGVSEWVPRVPGLFWNDDSQKVRDLAIEEVEDGSNGRHLSYTPIGKSMKVEGGVGTIKFPPDDLDRRLVTLTASSNVSAGIPALIHPEVWEHFQFSEGSVIDIGNVPWKKMTRSWAREFMTTKDIPRGYLEVNHPDQITHFHGKVARPIAHPYSILRYEKEGLTYFDFMYVSIDPETDEAQTKQFLESYKHRRGRENAQYLIESDINDPLYEAEYTHPREFRDSGQAHLDLMRTRIDEHLIGENTSDELYHVITKIYTIDDLSSLSDHLGVSRGSWLSQSNLSTLVAKFISVVKGNNKLSQLLEYLVKAHGAQVFQMQNT